jgi:CBS domain-containing protein
VRPAAGNLVDPTKILARDIMRPDVLVLRADDTIRSAAEQLEEILASGAPVVDAAGRLVGVLTQSDIARSEHVGDDGVQARPARALAAEPPAAAADEDVDEDEEVFPTDEYDDEVLGRLRVADWMSPGVIQVPPDLTVAAVCRRMLDEAIHRVFVVEQKTLLGVVSTEDVVRLLAEPSKRGVRRRPAKR